MYYDLLNQPSSFPVVDLVLAELGNGNPTADAVYVAHMGGDYNGRKHCYPYQNGHEWARFAHSLNC